MRVDKLVLIVKLAHRRMDAWSSLYTLYTEYFQEQEVIDVLQLIVDEMKDNEQKLLSLGWKLVSAEQWVYIGNYPIETAMIEAGLGLPVSEVEGG